MLNLILDSNVFLHAKFFTDVPWNELAGEDVCIVVPRMVLRELDQLKYGSKPEATKQRGAKVARRLFELVKEAKAAASESAVLRTGVRLRVETKDPDLSQGDFDRDAQDDHILATCLGLRGVLCSRDVGFMLKAEAYDVRYIELPDAWVEPSVPDPLLKELEMYRSRAPKLQAVARIGGRLATEGAAFTIMALRPPTSDEILSLAFERTNAIERRSRAQRSELADAWLYEHGSDVDREIERREEQLQRIQLSLWQEAKRLATKGRELELELSVINAGTSPATEIEVDLTVAAPAELIHPTGRIHVGSLMHTRENVAGTVTLRFPPEFMSGGARISLKLLAAELPKPLERVLNIRVSAEPVGPFEGMSTDY